MSPLFCILLFSILAFVEGGPTKQNPSVLPIPVDVSVRQQHIRISLAKDMSPVAKLYCIPLKPGRPNPSQLYLKEDLQIHTENVISRNTPKPFMMETDEVMLYNRVSCIYAEENRYYGPQIFILIPNLAEEQTDMAISSITPSSDSVSFKVAVTSPVLVWCNAFTSDRTTIKDLKMVRNVFVHKSDIVTVKDLTPLMNYTLFCYAESFSGTGMKNTIASLATPFTTTKMEAAIVNVKNEDKDVAFSITSNVERTAVCKCISDSRTVLAMNAGNDYLCRNSIDLPLILCRFYYPTELVDVDYHRDVDTSYVVVDTKRAVSVIDRDPVYSASPYIGWFFECVAMVLMMMTVKNKLK